MSDKTPIYIIGAGLAGSECAYQLAKRGLLVELIEMRPKKSSPAHMTTKPAELVCSNSFRSNDVSNAVGLLKEEMAKLDSLVIEAAYQAKVPAGSSLAVDRDVFSNSIQSKLNQFKNLTIRHDVVMGFERDGGQLFINLESGENLKCSKVVIATGPLTDEPLAKWILESMSEEYLYFYDSIAPIVDRDSINMDIAFRASRYGKGETAEGDYINCPMDQNQYEKFIEDINAAELVAVKDFDQAQFFDGCLPIEEMVRRGAETLRYGPLKPVGLAKDWVADIKDLKKTDKSKRPHAVVQLRQDNLHNSLYNMVGFQTRLKWPDQKRIFRSIPGLEQAEFHRMGAMHRNTYICSPKVLKNGMTHQAFPEIHFAGQITGCEGYVESAAVGLYVGLFISKQIFGANELTHPPQSTALGALIHHILNADGDNYQPMNINFGLFSELTEPVKKFDRKLLRVKTALNQFRQWYYQNLSDLENQRAA
ncbi:methylenetetrahydrofolate--tRNA-(uracil(54)-C(5))-methyltransferase (FADH(2)-oxidizing) TrmFO [bacterium K02(2017)]|nr:methylenetetrahydrofolate--tRNA-(uracil(54)-C(5))-methyltransferase (FADH(2)-oxidizing) TrmFO [bacterium K02(2017)]